MNDILILEEVVNEILGNTSEQYALFGQSGCVNMNGKKYDFMFHAVKGVPFKKLQPDDLLVVPALPYVEGLDNVEAVVYEVYKGNPSLTTYAIREDRPKTSEQKGVEDSVLKVIPGITLAFVDVIPVSVGGEVKRRDYTIATEEDFQKRVPNWGKFQRRILELRGELDREYAA